MSQFTEAIRVYWVDAFARPETADETDRGGGNTGHPAIAKLLRLVNLEVEP